MSIATIGLDTAKSVSQVHAVDGAGQVVIRRKLHRDELLTFFEKQGACTVVMEACGAAHHWGRALTDLGHTVRLVAPEAVRPFVKRGKKNDAADAAAICEAASRPGVTFVPIRPGRLLVLGTTSMVHRAAGWNSAAGAWTREVLQRRPVRLVTVALANKMARIAWALTTRKEVYHAKGRPAAAAPAPAAA